MGATSIPEAVAIHFAGQCDRGKVRAENQDSVRQCATALGDLLIVADGIGGYTGGAVASRLAVDVISASLESMPAFFPPAIAIQEAACRANAEIFAAAAEPGTPNHHMGSTVVLALLQPDPENAQAPVQVWIGHIGDSRAYLLHNRRLARITRDHSAIQLLLDRDLINPEQARNHPDASVLTRTLGHEPNVEIELDALGLEPGDTLLLCSDGLWGYVADHQIERVLADPVFSAEQASRALLDLALAAGGHDNIGIQLARLPGPAPESLPADVVLAPEPAGAPAALPDSVPAPVLDSVLDSALAPEPPSIIESALAPEPAPAPIAEAEPVLENSLALQPESAIAEAEPESISAPADESNPLPEILPESAFLLEIARKPDLATAPSPEQASAPPAETPAENASTAGSSSVTIDSAATVSEPVPASEPESQPSPEPANEPVLTPDLESATLLQFEPLQFQTPEFESPQLQTPQFRTIDPPGTSWVKMVMILTVSFAASGALVYAAVLQNWFGIDNFLHLR
jgi:PPM family protein phosphatase